VQVQVLLDLPVVDLQKVDLPVVDLPVVGVDSQVDLQKVVVRCLEKKAKQLRGKTLRL
jgi:hypothetical protein